ncbi:MAG: lactonase family protein [Luteolibacter sp.]
MKNELTLLIGSYTQPEAHVPGACGEGIVTCSFDPATGRLEKRSVFKDMLNPSYLASDPTGRKVFAVSENIAGEGTVWQLACAADGALTPTVQQNSHGAATCHVAVLPDDRVCVTSFFGGTAVYRLTNGKLAPAERVFRYQGRGVHPQRQEASHAHQAVVSPDQRWFYVCDLGADCVWQHDIAANDAPVGLPMPAGHGPRHMAFHPSLPRAWVLGELTGAVAVCDWNAQTGALAVVAITPAIEMDASAAAIRVHPTGRCLWTSTRKHPALRAYQLDASGLPGTCTEVPLSAGEPRDFTISPDGRWLLAATQQADEVVVIELDPSTGLPAGTPHQFFPINTPVCVFFPTEINHS